MNKLKVDVKRDCNSVLYIRHVSDALKDYFKAYCARRGKTMSQVIKEFMKETVKNEGIQNENERKN